MPCVHHDEFLAWGVVRYLLSHCRKRVGMYSSTLGHLRKRYNDGRTHIQPGIVAAWSSGTLAIV